MIRSAREEINATAHSGFSFLELIVVMLILSVISVATLRFVANMSEVYVIMAKKRQADDETISALARMRREIRSLQTMETANTGELSFVSLNQVTNTFVLTGSDLKLNGRNLARNVDTFVLTYYDSTNGLLAPVPLSEIDMWRVSRVGIRLSVNVDGQSSEQVVDVFYPYEGILK